MPNLSIRLRFICAVTTALAVALAWLAPVAGTISIQACIIASILAALSGFCLFYSLAGRMVMRSVLAAALLAIGVASITPAVSDSGAEIEVVATGERNPRSQGSEVFVRMDSRQGSGEILAPKWEKRGETYVSYQSQPSSWRYMGSWTAGAKLSIVQHPYSGVAIVKVAGQQRRYDLYSPEQSTLDVALPVPNASIKGIARLAALSICAFIATLALARLTGASRKASWLLAACLAFAGLSGVWVSAASYPGAIDLVAFESPGGVSTVVAGQNGEWVPALKFDAKAGPSIKEVLHVSSPLDWRLAIHDGSLNYIPGVNAAETAVAPIEDMGCPLQVKVGCIYEISGDQPSITISGKGESHALQLPHQVTDAASKRMFLRVLRTNEKIELSVSRASVSLTPWATYARWMTMARILDNQGRAAEEIYEIDYEDGAVVRPLAQGKDGTVSLRPMRHVDTPTVTGMKYMAMWMGFLWSLAVGVIVLSLMAGVRAFRSGAKFQTVIPIVMVLGTFGYMLVISWPGVLGWDGFSPYIQAQAGQVTLWYGTGYPLSVGALLLRGDGFWITVWQLTLALATFFAVIVGCASAPSRRVQWLPTILTWFWLPFSASAVGAVTHLRDNMNGLVFAAFYVTIAAKFLG